MEKFNLRSCRMFNDFMEISDNLRRPQKDYEYTDANKERMRDIINNPTSFSEDEKTNTLLSFHKDTCANIMLGLYPSSTRDPYRDAFEDLETLKRFEPVLVALELEVQKTYSKPSYQYVRARKQQLQMRVSMSVYLKSSDATALPEDIKNWMLQKLGCNDYSYDVRDNDEERLEGLKSGISDRLAHLQSLGVDTSKYQDSDDGNQYLNFQPTRATIDEYMLEEEITRTHDDLIQLSEDAHPFDQYLESVKNNVETLESVVNEKLRKYSTRSRRFRYEMQYVAGSYN
ncbi:hypothetical protein MKW98_020604 [Papaver atlanticum]|uniref:Uncharacterized protein n=1 Tax=Papaver atlanticum TaxID=357466 RepID=A0AAD4THL9_9MAGN|nr:hypothetical protein MKW98_020604 [Papaver atlanticum]